MANKNRTKRAMLLSVLSLIMCFSMFVGTTYAWFTDSVTSAKNKIVAGTLDVELKYQNALVDEWTSVEGKSNIFDPNALWEPGHVEVAYFEVSNIGSLAMKYLFSLNVYGETEGVNVAGETFKLSDFLMCGLVENVKPGELDTRDVAISKVTKPMKLSQTIEGGNNRAVMSGAIEEGADAEYIAIVIWMPTTVGNEANYRGVSIPTVELGVTLLATQYTDENDSFGNGYDVGADYPTFGYGSTKVLKNHPSAYYVEARGTAGGKLGTANVFPGAVDENADTIGLSIEKTDLDGNVTLTSDQGALTYDVTVTGLKANNTTEINVDLRAEPNLTGVKLFHTDKDGNTYEVTNAVYNPHTGYISFYSDNFSPFTIVYDKEPETVVGPTPSDKLPEASVMRDPNNENVDLPWESYGSWSPTAGLEAKLEAAYEFAITETVEQAKLNKYADWYCDFYVSLDKDLGKNELFLGGNYGSFGWVGFHNGDIELAANTEIPLLGSVVQKPWTYAEVAQAVGNFKCGVGDVNDALNGATFTVKLRLTNPANEAEYYDVATVNYTFGNKNPADLPEANVQTKPQYVNAELPWGSYGPWSPSDDLDAMLEAAYEFSITETSAQAAASKYANWYCDFYVSLDKDLGKNEIFLGGNYGDFGWVGFHNGDLELAANTEIPLLGSVTTNPWTYAQVAQNVGTFTCGVGDVDDALVGATFTVKLRLTNPANEAEYYDVETVEYTFVDLPEANVVKNPEYVNSDDIEWGEYGSWSPTEGLDAKLEAAYTFSITETLADIEAGDYADWYCDFYVMLDKDLGENEIFLGGNYGDFGWVGFHNGDVTLDANTELPLLGSVTSNPWTYAQVAQNVETFTCGVGDVNDALEGATFTVMLRLTNPENANEFYNVATVNYTFE